MNRRQCANVHNVVNMKPMIKVLIGDKVYNSATQPIAIIFTTEDDRKTVAQQLTDMMPRDGIRIFCQSPSEIDKDVVSKFMMNDLDDEQLAAALEKMEVKPNE